MGRAKAFDPQTVLSAAMHAFRRKGFRGVSVRDLETATDLKMGSIYNSYGDKAGLFDAAFAHYNEVVLRRRLERHAPLEAGLGGVRALFRSLLNEPGGRTFGCLITNSAVEFGDGEGMHRCVGEGLALLQAAFGERLAAAARDGLLRPGLDPAISAVKLLALYQGLLVLIRAGQDRRVLERMVASAFDELEGRRHG